MKKFLLLLILLVGCGKEPIVPCYIDSMFKTYINEFKRDASQHGAEEGAFDRITVMMFDEGLDSTNEFAECRFKNDYKHFFEVNFYDHHWREMRFSTQFKLHSAIYQYKIFLHEIGHCAYHLAHTNYDLSAIMNETIYPLNNKFEHEKDLFFKSARENQAHWFDITPI